MPFVWVSKNKFWQGSSRALCLRMGFEIEYRPAISCYIEGEDVMLDHNIPISFEHKALTLNTRHRLSTQETTHLFGGCLVFVIF